MLLNSCATSSNSSFYVNEELQNEDFLQVLSAKDLFFINDSNAEKSILNRDLVLEALKYKSLDKDQWDALMLLSESNYLKPFGKKVIDQLVKNKRKLQEVKSISLSINVDERYKNYLIQAATNIDKRINIIFDEEIPKIDINLNILNKSLPGFCNSFQNDQLNSVEKVIFFNDLLQAKDTLIIYEDIFSGQQYKLKNKYTNVKIIEGGGWHFTNIKSPEDIFMKLSNYGEHNEFEMSDIDITKMSKLVKEKKVYFNHTADKTDSNKYSYGYELVKINKDLLPKFLVDNYSIFKDWFEYKL